MTTACSSPTEILVADEEVTFIRRSSTGVVDVVSAPIGEVQAKVCCAPADAVPMHRSGQSVVTLDIASPASGL